MLAARRAQEGVLSSQRRGLRLVKLGTAAQDAHEPPAGGDDVQIAQHIGGVGPARGGQCVHL